MAVSPLSQSFIISPFRTMILYFLPASFVFAFGATRLIQDPNTETSNLGMWLVVTLAALVWPITSPSMVKKQVQNLREQNQMGSRGLAYVPSQWLEDDLNNGFIL